MNTFQVVAIGALVSILAVGAYYVVEADSAGLLGKSIAGNRIVASEEQLSRALGTYACDSSTGCKNEYLLVLRGGGEGELSASIEDGAEIVMERGTWGIGERGYLTLTLFANQGATYDIPKTILIRSIGTSTLSRIVYSANQYQDMIHPIFVKKLEE